MTFENWLNLEPKTDLKWAQEASPIEIMRMLRFAWEDAQKNYPKWKPSEDEYVWKFFLGNRLKSVEVYKPYEDSYDAFAKIGDINTEKDWTWEQFVERGDVHTVEAE